MKSEFNYPKFNVRLSKSGSVIIINDELGAKVLVNANLVRHVLGIPFTKKDGTFKSEEDIATDKERAKHAYALKLMQVME